MTLPPFFFVFDVESVGLHGDGFAVGFVLIDAKGQVHSDGKAWCDSAFVAQGSPEDREWVRANIPDLLDAFQYDRGRSVRDHFWRAWMDARRQGAWMVADCPWPVEARFLFACIADDPANRAPEGPYPLLDVASVRAARGLDPLGVEARLPDELPVHDPLADARQSARLLIEALSVRTSQEKNGHE